MSTMRFDVVPRTIESSISATRLPRTMLFTGAVDTVEEALEVAKPYLPEKPTIILMPEGSLTVPRVEN